MSVTAVSVMTVLTRQITRRISRTESKPFELAAKLPTDKKVDIILGMLLNTEWQKRRMVYTATRVFFALPGDEQVRDRIPMEEITAVEMMREEREFEKLLLTVSEARKRLNTPSSGGHKNDDEADSQELCQQIVNDLQKLAQAARMTAEGLDRFKRSQNIVKGFYKSFMFQVMSAALLIANFGLSIAEAQMDLLIQPDSAKQSLINTLEICLVAMFSCELAINAYANWFYDFVRNYWNMFDLLLICTSLIGLAPIGLPLRLVLLLRSCRILRVFGKIKAVKKILTALFHSLIPMANAFFIIFTIASMYAIIGVTFYHDDDPDHFSTFSRAFIAMFRITIGSVEWWFDHFPSVGSDGSVNVWTSVFLITYVILVNWIFFQVSIAVLIDSFLAESNSLNQKEQAKLIREKQLEKQFKNPLDPLLLRLSKEYINDADLSFRLHELFKVLDSSGSGDLTSQEFQDAIKKLDFAPRIFMSDSDFIAITRNGALCDENGRLRAHQFETMMRDQLRLYAQARLSSTSEFWAISDSDFAPIAALKQILVEQLRLRSDQDAMRAETIKTLRNASNQRCSCESRSLLRDGHENCRCTSCGHGASSMCDKLLGTLRKCIREEISAALQIGRIELACDALPVLDETFAKTVEICSSSSTEMSSGPINGGARIRHPSHHRLPKFSRSEGKSTRVAAGTRTTLLSPKGCRIPLPEELQAQPTSTRQSSGYSRRFDGTRPQVSHQSSKHIPCQCTPPESESMVCQNTASTSENAAVAISTANVLAPFGAEDAVEDGSAAICKSPILKLLGGQHCGCASNT